MKVNWELMEKIFFNLNPSAFKKSFNWDFKEYELKSLNKDINDSFVFWEIREKVSLHYDILQDLYALAQWVKDKQEQYLGEEVRLESYSRYTSYPDTEEIYCLITKNQESLENRNKRIKLYEEEMHKFNEQELVKKKQQEEREKQEFLRLKSKFEKDDL